MLGIWNRMFHRMIWPYTYMDSWQVQLKRSPSMGMVFPCNFSPANIIMDHVQIHQVGDDVSVFVQALQGHQVSQIPFDQSARWYSSWPLSDMSMRWQGEPIWKAVLAVFTALSTSPLFLSAT
jgi:hypothetical protein